MKVSKKYQAYLLFPLALFYWGVIYWRNLFYRFGFFVSHRLPCKVISIGNITTGGTGKTPTVIYFCRYLQEKGCRVAVLSRGYGRSTKGTIIASNGNGAQGTWQETGDEPHLMARKLKNVPIIVDEFYRICDGQNRFTACKTLKKPIHYIVVEGLTLDDVQRLNANTKTY